ncbi:MAG TPA: TMEM175 family protein [Thiobacillaceae bacterium]|nr:TMEM175 family protein [Thiobacillaceae bacterium]
MGKGRVEAFSDGVLAIIITIMVLELKVPHGDDLSALGPLIPVFISYVLSFVYLGIYWSNHHHMLHAASKVNGRILWANFICCSGSPWFHSSPAGWAKTILPHGPSRSMVWF